LGRRGRGGACSYTTGYRFYSEFLAARVLALDDRRTRPAGGAVLGGAALDFVILFASMRRDGKSLGQMAREEIGKVAGFAAAIAVLSIMVIMLAVMALVVVTISSRGFPVTVTDMTNLAGEVGERTLFNRTGGGRALIGFWYHLAIMFEALVP
jgi:carbon starvation protein CstA